MPKVNKIVVIDDEPRMCESLKALLTESGYDVSAFQSSTEGLEAVRQSKVDLVISDIIMPEMDGLQILREVKKIDDGIPVILVTAYGALDSAMEAIEEGAYDYLLKPVEFNNLELAVKRGLEKRHSELEQLRLMEELKLSNMMANRRINELNALYKAGKSIGSSANLNELLRQIVALASEVTEASVGSIMLLDENNTYLTIEAAIGLSDKIVRTTHLPIGASIAGYVAKTGEALIVNDVENDTRFQRINKEKYGPASLLCTPLKIKNVVLGVINMAHKAGGESFTEDDLRLLSTFASQAAVAVDDAYQFEKNRRRLVEFEVLHEIHQAMNDINSLKEFRDLLIRKLKRVFDIDYAIWFDVDFSGSLLTPGSVMGKIDLPLTESGQIDISAAKQAELVLADIDFNEIDMKNSETFSELVASRMRGNKVYPEPTNAYIAVPIYRSGELSHVFYLGSDREHAYSDDDHSMARLVMNQAALLFEKERALLNGTRLLTMGNMISEISHDLRKPLTSIRGALQIFRERHEKITAESELYGMAEEEVLRMNDMVNELVDFSNPNKYETSRTDLYRLAKRVGNLIEAELTKNKVDLEYNFDELNWETVINKNQMLEVFLNLFLNAIDAMKDGGKLTIVGTIEIPEHKKESYLTIKIIDTGHGIPKELIPKIFERYYTTKQTGTGLGLVVVERIISAHQGTLAVKSDVGIGTTFIVYLPRQA